MYDSYFSFIDRRNINNDCSGKIRKEFAIKKYFIKLFKKILSGSCYRNSKH